ncbi:unnamed protein product [Phytomonas sp. Hart1]|nr:unnamed protein product [Phytomonas sp. Hart1]|eukprot:CCW71720.1 unnamed protein product [Phytomonas sp. isolate Hart1]
MNEEDLDGIEILPDNPEELFEELENAGTGNFGVVIKARNRQTNEIVAIKQVLMTDKSEVDNIQREIIILKRCVHANIVRYYGTYQSLGKLWIVMEYCEGGSVDLVYKLLRHPLPEKLIAYVCREVLLALEYLHANRRLHRDVKGSNILLTQDGHIKLVDFGVSVELLHSMEWRNTFIGTVLWMAPEAILEMDYGDRADLWSLGITLIEMAENGPPHAGMHVARAVFQIPREDPPVLKKKDQWSPQMNFFLKRLLVKDKNARPGASTMLQDPFVQPENIGTAEQMKAIIDEILEKKKSTNLNNLRSANFSSSSSNATFVHVRDDHSDSDEESNPNNISHNISKQHGGCGIVGGESHSPRHPDAAALSELDEKYASATMEGLLPLPLLSAEDLSFDELALAELNSTKPPAEEVEELYAMLAPDAYRGGVRNTAAMAGVKPPEFILQTTHTLAQAYRYRRMLPQRLRTIDIEEKTRTQQLMEKYGIALKNIYRI